MNDSHQKFKWYEVVTIILLLLLITYIALDLYGFFIDGKQDEEAYWGKIEFVNIDITRGIFNLTLLILLFCKEFLQKSQFFRYWAQSVSFLAMICIFTELVHFYAWHAIYYGETSDKNIVFFPVVVFFLLALALNRLSIKNKKISFLLVSVGLCSVLFFIHSLKPSQLI